MEHAGRLAFLVAAALGGAVIGVGCWGRKLSITVRASSGDLVPDFGTGGVVTSNRSTTMDYAQAVVSDSTSLYIVGYDDSPALGNYQWRIEKRSVSTGLLVTGFGTGGTATSDPSTGADYANAVVSDGTDLYIVGSDNVPGGNDTRWRIEKRSLSSGALVSAFGTGGVVTSDPSTDRDYASSAATDGTYLYIVGTDVGLGYGNEQWRVEKRSLSTGALATGFGTGGVVLSNPSSTGDWVRDEVIDGTDLFLMGSDQSIGPGPSQWRIEKRALSTGALVAGFGTGGVVTSHPSTGTDWPLAGLSDGNNLYVTGYESNPSSSDTSWRIEARSLTNGALVLSFGSGGVVTSNPGPDWDAPQDIVSDGADLFVVGSRGTPPSSSDYAWRVEKRSLASGASIASFGLGGTLTSDPSSSVDVASAGCIVWTSLFVVGIDSVAGAGDEQWRIEKRTR